MLAVFRALPKELAAEVFSDLPPEDQQALIQAATDQELSAIVEELWVDDAVDLLEELPAGVVKRVLQAARPDTRQLINQFLHYPENSVGSIMTAEFTDLKRDMTVAQAIAHIRRTGADSESIYTLLRHRRRPASGRAWSPSGSCCWPGTRPWWPT